MDSAEEGIIMFPYGLVASITLLKADLYFTDISQWRDFVVFLQGMPQPLSAVALMLCQ